MNQEQEKGPYFYLEGNTEEEKLLRSLVYMLATIKDKDPNLVLKEMEESAAEHGLLPTDVAISTLAENGWRFTRTQRLDGRGPIWYGLEPIERVQNVLGAE